MQLLERLRFATTTQYADLVYRLDQYLARISTVLNATTLDREWTYTSAAVANGTYPLIVPRDARKVIGVGFILQAGTCDVDVQQGAQTISWETAAGTTLSVTTTAQTDRADSSNVLVADDAVKIVVANVAGAAGLSVTLRTGA